MKTIVMFLNCVKGKIKNKFFKSDNPEEIQACEQWKKITDELKAGVDENGVEEYLVTTRWQTV